jgi:Glycosyl transferase family 2/Glycosyl transferases group 1
MRHPIPLPRPMKRVLRRVARVVGITPTAKRGSQSTRQSEAGTGGSAERRPAALADELTQLEPAVPQPARPEIRAAVAVGDRLRVDLAWEWDQRPVLPADWPDVLTAHSPALVLLEIADGSIPGWGAADGEEIAKLCMSCRNAGVPVVLWVTAGADLERSHTLANFTDLVFAPDEASAAEWSRAWAVRVEPLHPAVQPRLHNPQLLPGRQRDRGVCMVIDTAVPDEEMAHALASVIIPAVMSVGSGAFDIWQLDRSRGGDLVPPALAKRVVGRRPYEQIDRSLPHYAVLLNVDRPSGSSVRQVLEAGASQTAVVTLPDLAGELPRGVAEYVAVGADAKSLRGEIVARLRHPELRDREAVKLHRAVLDGHTYASRVDIILDRAGLARPLAAGSVSVVVPTNRVHELGNILENVGRQAYPRVELVLVLHGIGVNQEEIRARATDASVTDLTIIEADGSWSLGRCMNHGVAAAAGAYVAKMDDDNFYGRHYLTDLVRAFDYTGAGIVGKLAHYVWLRSTGAVVLRFPRAEHTFQRLVQGGSIVFRRDVVRELRFGDLPRGVDTDILDRARAAGIKTYSADRFNFASVRGTDRDTHTWKVDDSFFMTASGRLVFYGDPRTHVDI